MSGERSEAAGADPAADGWDAIADERERLANERELLADGREHLANERERLADEQERMLDERYATWTYEETAGAGSNESTALSEAEEDLARAEARVQRALAERDRAEASVERTHEASERSQATTNRNTSRAAMDALTGDELGWATERRSFVASERERLAGERDRLQDAREAIADERERFADERDAGEFQRARVANDRDARSMRATAGAARARTERARADLTEIRDAARRQRQTAARQRHQAHEEREESGLRNASSGVAPTAYGPRLAAEFTALTRELFASQDLAGISRRVLGFALEVFPDCTSAGVTVLNGSQPLIHITSDAVARQLDASQIDAGNGPLAEAIESSEPVYVPAFDAARWPRLAPTASQLGVAAMIAYGLAIPREGRWQPLGTLTLYSELPDAFDAESRELGGILACYLAVAAGLDRDRTDLTRREAALHRALGTRDIIGQAKGILMERRRLSADAAFDVLRRTSQRLNLRVHELAARLAETGELPD